MKLTIDISPTLQIESIRKINPSPDLCLLLLIKPTIAPPLFPLLDRRQETASQQDKMPDYVNENDDTREHKITTGQPPQRSQPPLPPQPPTPSSRIFHRAANI